MNGVKPLVPRSSYLSRSSPAVRLVRGRQSSPVKGRCRRFPPGEEPALLTARTTAVPSGGNLGACRDGSRRSCGLCSWCCLPPASHTKFCADMGASGSASQRTVTSATSPAEGCPSNGEPALLHRGSRRYVLASVSLIRSGCWRISDQYSSRTSSSISTGTRSPYKRSPPAFFGPEIQYSSPVSMS